MIEAGGEIDIVDGELLNWLNLNPYEFKDDYSDEEEETDMLNLVPSSEKKMVPYRLNPFYLYLDTCSTFNKNINKNTIRYIWKVVQGLKSHRNGGGSRANQKVNYGVLLVYPKTWFHPNGMGNILSFSKV